MTDAAEHFGNVSDVTDSVDHTTENSCREIVAPRRVVPIAKGHITLEASDRPESANLCRT